VLLRTAAASALPRLAGCSWRADHALASSSDRGAGTSAPPPTFSLTLRTAPTAAAAAGAAPAEDAPDADAEDAQRGGAIALTLSLEQMQRLSFSLKEALRAAEREATA
jgi:hypothetical protein